MNYSQQNKYTYFASVAKKEGYEQILQLIGCESFGIQLMLYIVCFFSMIFGINILLSLT